MFAFIHSSRDTNIYRWRKLNASKAESSMHSNSHLNRLYLRYNRKENSGSAYHEHMLNFATVEFTSSFSCSPFLSNFVSVENKRALDLLLFQLYRIVFVLLPRPCCYEHVKRSEIVFSETGMVWPPYSKLDFDFTSIQQSSAFWVRHNLFPCMLVFNPLLDVVANQFKSILIAKAIPEVVS